MKKRESNSVAQLCRKSSLKKRKIKIIQMSNLRNYSPTFSELDCRMNRIAQNPILSNQTDS